MIPLLGTAIVEGSPVMEKGKLVGCEISFSALHYDGIYHLRGGFLKINGNVVIRKNLVVLMKVEVNVLTEENPTLGTPSAPSRVYLIDSNQRTNVTELITTIPGDLAGTALASFTGPNSGLIVVRAFEANTLTIAFNQNDGNADVLVPIQLNAAGLSVDGERKVSGKTQTEFFKCMRNLVDDLKGDLEKSPDAK